MNAKRLGYVCMYQRYRGLECKYFLGTSKLHVSHINRQVLTSTLQQLIHWTQGLVYKAKANFEFERMTFVITTTSYGVVLHAIFSHPKYLRPIPNNPGNRPLQLPRRRRRITFSQSLSPSLSLPRLLKLRQSSREACIHAVDVRCAVQRVFDEQLPSRDVV